VTNSAKYNAEFRKATKKFRAHFNRSELCTVAKPGVSKWGEVKGRVREGVHPLPVGVRGLCPGKIFKLQMHVNALTPVFMPVDFGKVPNPFDF
jgi:hypothetical protein